MSDEQGVREKGKARPRRSPGKAHAAEQPFRYPLERAFVEPDWTRLPGFKGVTKDQWESAQWQRAHTVKNLVEFKRALGENLDDPLYADIERDQRERATMSMLIPPQMINTMNERDLWSDPVRRYMAPAFSERHPEWPSHPMASRDSLHEAEMWAVEGLTHRYPTKVLAEMIPTCPQYCGHCTRMDLVGNDTAQVLKYKFEMKQNERWDAMLDYLRRTPSVRDVVVSGGDIANIPIARLEDFMMKLLDIPNIRDVRLATKGLMGIPQHFLQDEVLKGYDRIIKRARERDIEIAVHTHINSAHQATPLVAKAVRALLDMGYRDVRNQGVLLRGVNTTPKQMLELCFMLIDHLKVIPYYFYHVRHHPERRALAHRDLGSSGAAVRDHGVPTGLRDAARRVRRVARRQALGPHAQQLRSHARDHVLAEELPHRHRVRRPRSAHARVHVLRPRVHAPRRGSGVLARIHPQGAARAPAGLRLGRIRTVVSGAHAGR